MRKTVCIINYNTPELVRAAIASIRRHGGERYKVFVLDNSDEKPIGTPSCPVPTLTAVIDNTKGQVIDFEAVLKSFPKRNVRIGCALGCNYGSVKHMLSVEWLVQHMHDGFVLMDSDVLLRDSVDDLFDSKQMAIGEVCKRSPRFVHRLLPFVCWLNAPMMREAGVHYHDPERSYGLAGDDIDDRRNWYDTGASLLEDLQRRELPWREMKLGDRYCHLGNGSWRRKGEWKDWLDAHQDLWSDGKCEDERVIKKIDFMEHCEKISARWGYTRLVADKGYQLRSKVTGQTYDEITVPDPGRFEVVPVEGNPSPDGEGTVAGREKDGAKAKGGAKATTGVKAKDGAKAKTGAKAKAGSKRSGKPKS